MTASDPTLRRLFVAIVPPKEVLESLARIPMRDEPGVSYTRPSQWHITLRFLGDASPTEAIDALRQVQCEPCDVALGPQVERLAKTVVMIPAAGLDEVAAGVTQAFDGIGRSAPEHDFVGHLTIARLKGRAQRRDGTVSVLCERITANFTATEVVLFASDLGADGAVHTALARQPLGGS